MWYTLYQTRGKQEGCSLTMTHLVSGLGFWAGIWTCDFLHLTMTPILLSIELLGHKPLSPNSFYDSVPCIYCMKGPQKTTSEVFWSLYCWNAGLCKLGSSRVSVWLCLYRTAPRQECLELFASEAEDFYKKCNSSHVTQRNSHYTVGLMFYNSPAWLKIVLNAKAENMCPRTAWMPTPSFFFLLRHLQ